MLFLIFSFFLELKKDEKLIEPRIKLNYIDKNEH